MSVVLDALIAQAAVRYQSTVTLSPESVTVLIYATGLLEQKSNWMDREEYPLDEITDSDWDTIEKWIANLTAEVSKPMIGMVFPIVTGTVPENCLLCDGSTYDRADYPVLYSKLDAAFILTADTFFVPDLRQRTLVGADSLGGAEYEVNGIAGTNSVSLSASENGTHSHSINMTTGLAVAPGELSVNIPIPLPLGSTNADGLGSPHENRMPFRSLNFAVVAL